ncbi:MAG: hypothetical protein ACK4NW_12885 [Roseinatronobacter sp.]
MKHHIILHAGLPKTGTSSVQQALHGYADEHCAYASWGDLANHSRPYILGFTDRVFRQKAEKQGGRNRSELEALRAQSRAQLQQVVARAPQRVLIFSAEVFGGAGVDALRDFVETLAPWTDTIEAICYVRPAVSTMASAFQQQCKLSPEKITLPPRVRYRAAIEPLFDVIGANVTVLPYARAELREGDVVLDFAHRCGVTLASDYKRANTSMTAEAAALLVWHGRHKRTRPATVDSIRVQNQLVKWISTLGSARLHFAPSLVLPALEKMRADLEWIEQLMGRSMADPENAQSGGIASEDDLLKLAQSVEAELSDLIAARSEAARLRIDLDATRAIADPARRLAALVDHLKDIAEYQVTRPASDAESRSAGLMQHLRAGLGLMRRRVQ